jgi:hypothetical protein
VIEKQQGEILKPDANTNLMWQRTLIPTIKASFAAQKSDFLVCAVFALARASDREERCIDIGKLWDDVPVISATAGGEDNPEWYITI